MPILHHRVGNVSFYGSKPWQELRAEVFAAHPTCQLCRAAASAIVDHIEPVRTHPHLRMERSNLWALCASCSGRITACFDLPNSPGIYQPGGACDAEGNPTDPLHPWNDHDATADVFTSKRALADYILGLPPLPVAERPPWQGDSGLRGKAKAKRKAKAGAMRGWTPVC